MAAYPNILLFHWHDLGRFLEPYGRSGVISPNMADFASQACVFDQAFCASPLCSPARAALFTGRYGHANGVLGLTHLPERWRYRHGEKTLPMYLRELGYKNYLFGQQHEGKPELIGYDECHIPTPQCWMEPVTEMFTDFLATRAREKQPFFASVGFFEVHRHGVGYSADVYGEGEVSSDEVPAFLPDEAPVRRELFRFYEAIRRADAHAGRIFDALRQKGLEENTWVIFTTDHGVAFPRAKSTLYDAGMEVALMMRWPGRLTAGQRIGQPVSHVDIVPTVLEALGHPVPDHLHGRSLLSLLDNSTSPETMPVFAEKNYHEGYDPIRCIRTDRYKLIRNFSYQKGFGLASDIRNSEAYRSYAEVPGRERPWLELYDLEQDPTERNNVAADENYSELRRDLDTQLTAWMKRTNDYLPGRALTPPSSDELCLQ